MKEYATLLKIDQKPKTEVSIASTSSDVERIVLHIRGREMFFETEHMVNPSSDFAIWASLPIAMRYGGVLQVNGATSAVARQNAEDISVIWSTWMPKLFRPLRVVSPGFVEPDRKQSGKDLMLYSGGVDSTFALKRHVEAGNPAPDLLTIHGMDYRRQDHERFHKLRERTSRFRELYAGDSIEVRSNAASVMRRFGISSSIGHGFQLFATLFLFDHQYDQGLIASDFTTSQDYLTIPWGTNSLTNPMFVGERMKISTLSNDVTRGEKLRRLHSDELSLRTLSFCKNYSVRPDNCGTCSKCVRTKAMFHAAGLEIPKIFLIEGFDANDLRFLDLSKPIEVAFCVDVLNLARESGRLDDFTIISDQLFSKTKPSKFSRFRSKVEAHLRGSRAKS